MINMEHAKQVFLEYVKNYDANDSKIALKIGHILRVMELSKLFAINLGWEKEDIEIATLIGLLHDIGRFEQIKVYHTFTDSESIDHANYGCEQLFEKGLIRKFIEEDTYDKIIEKAIYNHNKLKIEEGLDERTLKHAKLIRDTDKTDIFETSLFSKQEDIFNRKHEPNGTINSLAIESFMNGETVKYADSLNTYDSLIGKLSFIYDYNYKVSLQYIKEKDYLNKIVKRFYETYEPKRKETKEQIEAMLKIANEYIEKNTVTDT